MKILKMNTNELLPGTNSAYLFESICIKKDKKKSDP